MKKRILGKVIAMLATGVAIVFWSCLFNGEKSIYMSLSGYISFALGVISFLLVSGFGMVVKAAFRVGKFGYGMLPFIFGLIPGMIAFVIAVVVFVQIPIIFVVLSDDEKEYVSIFKQRTFKYE